MNKSPWEITMLFEYTLWKFKLTDWDIGEIRKLMEVLEKYEQK